MKTLVYSILIILISSQLFAQPKKAKERISMIKKIKLLEVLDLDEKQSDLVISKYSAWEKKIESQLESFDKAEEDLVSAIKKGDKKVIIAETDKFIKQKDLLVSVALERDDDMKTILNETQYAKYLIFEKKFRKELGEQIMKHRRKNE